MHILGGFYFPLNISSLFFCIEENDGNKLYLCHNEWDCAIAVNIKSWTVIKYMRRESKHKNKETPIRVWHFVAYIKGISYLTDIFNGGLHASCFVYKSTIGSIQFMSSLKWNCNKFIFRSANKDRADALIAIDLMDFCFGSLLSQQLTQQSV